MWEAVVHHETGLRLGAGTGRKERNEMALLSQLEAATTMLDDLNLWRRRSQNWGKRVSPWEWQRAAREGFEVDRPSDPVRRAHHGAADRSGGQRGGRDGQTG